MHRDILSLLAALDDAERDARAIVADLDDHLGAWRPAPEAWSVAQCLDHLAVSNRVYLKAMEGPVPRARERGRLRRGPAVPGFIGRWFVRQLEPPVKARQRLRAPGSIVPQAQPALQNAFASFCASQAEVGAALRAMADLDLARIRFPNPFIRGVRFSLATGFHVIVAHERRHLWQAWNVRRAAETATAASASSARARAIA